MYVYLARKNGKPYGSFVQLMDLLQKAEERGERLYLLLPRHQGYSEAMRLIEEYKKCVGR